MGIIWLESDKLLPEVRKKIKPAKIILDIGCGIRPQKLIKAETHICCDPFKQYLLHLQKKPKPVANCNYIYLQTKWEDLINIFPAKSVGTIFLIDVIEHLNKENGFKLLTPTEKIARRQVVIFTPLGFFPQEHPNGKDAWGYGGGSWQNHRSGWFPKDFDKTWDIYACNNFHKIDNMGNKLSKPVGAFWAIKTHH